MPKTDRSMYCKEMTDLIREVLTPLEPLDDIVTSEFEDDED
jgi:hypothetical protein